MSSRHSSYRLMVASALTPVHPGAGRSPGIVDLPVVRDSLGYPYIPGSEVKGALKTALARALGALKGGDGYIDCGKARDLCCLLGPEVEDQDKHMSAVVISHLFLVAIPAPSPESPRGVVYLTSPSRLAILSNFLNSVGSNDKAAIIREAASLVERRALASFNPGAEYVRIHLTRVPVAGNDNGKARQAGEALSEVFKSVKGLHEVASLADSLLIVPESMAPTLFEKSLLRHTRVRLNRDTKTVWKGGLWTEEYIPYGSLFAGLIGDSTFRGAPCGKTEERDDDDAVARLSEIAKSHLSGKDGNTFYLMVGGKETIGSGLLNVNIITG